MARYKRRADGLKEKKVFIGYDEETGKRIMKSIYATSDAALEREAAKLKADVLDGTYADDRGLSVSSWAEKWLAVYKTKVAESTLADYQNIIKNHIKPIAHMRLRDVKKSDVMMCINLADGHWDIQRRIKMTLSQMFEDAIDDKLLYTNVCRGITIPNKPKSTGRALSSAEKSAILNCDFSAQEKMFVFLLWYTGLRPEEARGLMRSDINLCANTITVSRAVVFSKGHPLIKEPKSASGYRTIDILNPLQPILREFLSKDNNLYLLHNKHGELMSHAEYRAFWNSIYNRINGKMGGTPDRTKRIRGTNKREKISGIRATDITPYAFRHEYATILYYSGIDIKESARLMGHSDTKLILEVYAELDKNKSSSSSKLNEYLRSYV